MTQKTEKKSSRLSNGGAVSADLLRTPLHKLLEETAELSQDELKRRIGHLRSLRASPPILKQQIESDEELGEEARQPKTDSKRQKKMKDIMEELGL